MIKNTASQKWRVYAYNTSTQAAVTGDAANITAKICIDHGTATAITDTNPTEVESGFYDFDLTQAETNGNILHIIPVSSTVSVNVVGVPQEFVTVASDHATAKPTAEEIAINDSAVMLRTTVSSVTSTTVFVLAGGDSTDDLYNGLYVVIIDAGGTTVRWRGRVSDYVGSTKTLTVDSEPSFTVASSDIVCILAADPYDSASDNVIVGSFASSALNALANSQIDVIGYVLPSGDVKIIKGDSYEAQDLLVFTQNANEDWPTLTGATVVFSAIGIGDDQDTPTGDTIAFAGTVVTATGSSKQVKFNLTPTETDIAVGKYNYAVWATLTGGEVVTLRRGKDKLEVMDSYHVTPSP